MIKMIVIIIIHELLVNSKCGDYYQGVWSHMKFDKVSKFGHLCHYFHFHVKTDPCAHLGRASSSMRLLLLFFCIHVILPRCQR